MEKLSFLVPSISCNVCSEKIKNSLSHMNGVENVNVDLVSKSVDVNYDEKAVDPSSIKNKVSSMGYEVQ